MAERVQHLLYESDEPSLELQSPLKSYGSIVPLLGDKGIDTELPEVSLPVVCSSEHTHKGKTSCSVEKLRKANPHISISWYVGGFEVFPYS